MPHDILTQYSSLFKVSVFMNKAHKSAEGSLYEAPLKNSRASSIKLI